jgi:hypothetical protein
VSHDPLAQAGLESDEAAQALERRAARQHVQHERLFGSDARPRARLGDGLERPAERVDEPEFERTPPAPDAAAGDAFDGRAVEPTPLFDATQEDVVDRLHLAPHRRALGRREAARRRGETRARPALDGIAADAETFEQPPASSLPPTTPIEPVSVAASASTTSPAAAAK